MPRRGWTTAQPGLLCSPVGHAERGVRSLRVALNHRHCYPWGHLLTGVVLCILLVDMVLSRRLFGDSCFFCIIFTLFTQFWVLMALDKNMKSGVRFVPSL